MIPIKNQRDLDNLKIAGKILSRIIKKLQPSVKPGVKTSEINDLAVQLAREEKVLCAFQGYKGFPAALCISLNDEIVHGIPGDRKLRKGDIVSLDFGIKYEGYFSDAAVTLAVGDIDSRTKKLVEVAKKALSEGIKQAKPGNHLLDISASIQSCVEINGFSVVRQFVGHGIGLDLHEEPEIPNFGQPHQGPILRSGMVFAIEPMVNMGTWESRILDNGWTAVTKDGMPSAHFEHTVAITDSGPEIFTS